MATELERLVVRLEADTERLRREMKRTGVTVDQSTRKMDKRLKRVDDAFNRAKAAAGKFALAMGAAFLSARAVAAIRATIDQAAALQDTSDKLGIAVEALQAYRFAAQEVGVEQNVLDMGLQRFVRRVGEAAAGAGELAPVIEELGISLRNADGTTRSAEAVLLDYAEAIKNAETQQERLRLAFKGFDSEAVGLVNLLSQGAEGMAEFRAEAERLGIIVPERITRQMQEADRALERVGSQMDVATVKLVANLLPAIEAVASAWGVMAGNLSIAALGLSRALVTLDLVDDPLIEAASRVADLRDQLALLQRQLDKPLTFLAEMTGDADTIRAEIERVRRELAEAEAAFQELFTAREEAMGAGAGIAEAPGGAIAETDKLGEALRNARFELALLTAGYTEAEIAAARAARAAGAIDENLRLTNEEEFGRLQELVVLYREIEAERAAAAAAVTEAGVTTHTTLDAVNRDLLDMEHLGDRAAATLTDGLRSAALDADNLSEALRNVGLRLLDVAATAINAPVEQALSAAISGGIGALLGGPAGAIGAFAAGAAGPPPVPGGLFGFAKGGVPTPGVPAIVGERGPELVVPMRPSRILSAQQTERALSNRSGGGNTFQFTINAPGASTEGMMAVVAELRAIKGIINNPLEMAKRSSEGFRRIPSLRGAVG